MNTRKLPLVCSKSIEFIGMYSSAVQSIMFNWIITPKWIVHRRLMCDLRIHRDNGVPFECIARMRNELKVPKHLYVCLHAHAHAH